MTHHESIQTYTAAISALDVGAFADCFIQKCEINDPVGAPVIHGHDGAKAFFNGMAALLSKIEMKPVAIHVGGTRAAFSWTMVAEGKQAKRLLLKASTSSNSTKPARSSAAGATGTQAHSSLR